VNYKNVQKRLLLPITSLITHRKTIAPLRQTYEVRIPDMVTVLCTFANGIEGVLEFSGIVPFPASDRLELYGSRGRLAYDFSKDIITGAQLGDPGPAVIPIPPELEQTWRVEVDFIAAVRSPGGILPQPGFGEGLEYMKVVQAVADSIDQGREIELT
jgi:predicted dehydrogenase